LLSQCHRINLFKQLNNNLTMELETFDKETAISLESPFYLISDDSMINFSVFRDPNDYQYAAISQDTFDRCKSRLIINSEIEHRAFQAEMDHFPNTLGWHYQYVDSLWSVSSVTSFNNWYQNSKFIGFFEGNRVRDLLPKTYSQFQNKRDELRTGQEKFERWIRFIRSKSQVNEPALF